MTNWILKLAFVFVVICLSNAAIYQINSYEYTPCIINVETDAVLHMTYHHSGSKSATATVSLPNDVDSVQGYCTQTELPQIYNANFELRFNGITLEMHFWAKYSMRDWHFDSVNLVYLTSNPLFDYIDHPAQQVNLTDDSANMLHLISIDDTINCNECTITFSFPDKNDTSHEAILYMRYFSFQCIQPKDKNHTSTPILGILGPVAAILFVLFVVVCLFFIHENKLMAEPA